MALGLHRHEVGEPLVVHATADRRVLVVDFVVARHRGRTGGRVRHDERDRVRVLAAVEDDLARDAVLVEVGEPLVHVVVASGAERRVLAVRAGLLPGRDERVVVVEELLRAVLAKVFLQPRPDVRVTRDDDDPLAVLGLAVAVRSVAVLGHCVLQLV